MASSRIERDLHRWFGSKSIPRVNCLFMTLRQTCRNLSCFWHCLYHWRSLGGGVNFEQRGPSLFFLFVNFHTNKIFPTCKDKRVGLHCSRPFVLSWVTFLSFITVTSQVMSDLTRAVRALAVAPDKQIRIVSENNSRVFSKKFPKISPTNCISEQLSH